MVAFVVLGLPLLVLALTLATETSRLVPIAIPNAAHDGTRHADEYHQHQAARRSITEDSDHPSGRHDGSRDRCAKNGACAEPYANNAGSPPVATAPAATPSALASAAASATAPTSVEGSATSSASSAPASPPPSTEAPTSGHQGAVSGAGFEAHVEQDYASSTTGGGSTPFSVQDATNTAVFDLQQGDAYVNPAPTAAAAR
jgi:hypothetical protein